MTTPVSTDASTEGERRRRRLLGWLSLGYLLFVGIFSAWACYASFVDRISVPIIDDWRILHDFYSMSFVEWLFSNQNGHRTTFTFGLFALDYAFFDGRQDLLVVATLVTAWLAVGILYLGYRGDRGLETPIARMAFGFACFATFWAGSGYNFLWGVCQGNLMVALWLFLSLTCLVGYVHPPQTWTGRGHLPVCAGIAALCASFSLGEGLGAWPALIAVAIVARLPLRVVALLGLGFVLTVAAYSLGLETTGKFSFSASAAALLRPIDLLEFVATFLGAALGRTGQGLGLVGPEALQETSCAFGAIGLVAFAIQAVLLLRRPSRVGPRELLALGILTFGVAAAMVVALGRVPRAPMSSAVAERFVNWSAMFWMGGVLAIPPLVRGTAGIVAATLIAVASVCMLPAVAQTRAGLMDFEVGASKASLGVLLGIRDRSLAAGMGVFVGLPLVTTDPELVRRNSRRAREQRFHRVSDRLKRDRRSFFAHPRADLPGATFAHRFSVVSPDRCQGAMGRPTPLSDAAAPAARVGGWARDGENRVPSLVVITDEAGIIRGLGTPAPLPAAAKGGSDRFPWSGYLAEFDASGHYSAYALLPDGRSACPLGGRR